MNSISILCFLALATTSSIEAFTYTSSFSLRSLQLKTTAQRKHQYQHFLKALPSPTPATARTATATIIAAAKSITAATAATAATSAFDRVEDAFENAFEHSLIIKWMSAFNIVFGRQVQQNTQLHLIIFFFIIIFFLY
jgi:hypothetical protein